MVMRRWFAAAAMALALVTTATLRAQQRQAHAPAPAPATPQTFQAPPPPVTLPFPPVPPPVAGGMNTGFPFTPPTATPPRDVFVVPPGSRVFTRTHVRPPIGFGGGSYYYGPQPMPETAAPQAPAAANGLLRLSSTPASGQVFVDGYYVGTLADVDAQRALTLPAGPHRVEIRAPGYEPATFDVRIDPTDTVTYRAALERIPAPPARAAAPAAATRMYVIPNCYLGNVPPRADRLPKGCDIKRVRVIS